MTGAEKSRFTDAQKQLEAQLEGWKRCQWKHLGVLPGLLYAACGFRECACYVILWSTCSKCAKYVYPEWVGFVQSATKTTYAIVIIWQYYSSHRPDIWHQHQPFYFLLSFSFYFLLSTIFTCKIVECRLTCTWNLTHIYIYIIYCSLCTLMHAYCSLSHFTFDSACFLFDNWQSLLHAPRNH